jgi:hypothetical protein
MSIVNMACHRYTVLEKDCQKILLVQPPLDFRFRTLMKPSMKNHLLSLAGARLRLLLPGVTICVLTALSPQAQETKPANLTGDWLMNFSSPNGDKVEAPMKLVQDGEKLTGALTGQNGMPSPILEGIIKDGEVSFKVNRQRNNQTNIAKYNGQLTGETIKGKFEASFGGVSRTIPFEIVREKEPVGASGTWRWSLAREEGDKADFTLKLNEDNGSLTGTSISTSGRELAISDAATKDDQISFKVIRERDDKKMTMQFQGKRDGDTIRGKIETDWSGEARSYDWEAKRMRRRR